MESNVNYTFVGAFVIVLIAVFVFGIIWLSSGFSLEQFSTYKIYMQESVSGLSVESPVEYNGVNVGEVTSVTLNKKNPQLVELLIEIKKGTPITEGTVAMLNTRGVTGITFIALKDKSTNLQLLRALPGQRYPVIKTAPSFFVRLDTALSQLSVNFKQVAESIHNLLDKDNQQSIKGILSNLQRVTGVLAVNSSKFDIIIRDTARASQQFGPLLQSSAGAARMLETQTLPQTYRLLSNMNDVMHTLAEVSEQIKQNPAVLIRGAAQPTLGPGETR